MTLMTRSVGLSLLIFIIVWVVKATGSFAWFVDLPSMAVVLGLIASGLLMSSSPYAIAASIGCAFMGSTITDPRKLRTYVAVHTRGYFLSWAGGIIGTLVGMIIMLQNMDDPSKIGPGMAIGFLPLLYGALIAELGFNLGRHVLIDNAELPEPSASGTMGVVPEAQRPVPSTMLAMGGTVVALILGMFGILLVSMSEMKSEDEYKAIVQQVQETFGARGGNVPRPGDGVSESLEVGEAR